MFYKGDLVKFWTVEDESCQASECFGFDPSCGSDWFNIQVYIKDNYGEIVKHGLIEVINSKGQRTGRLYRISKGEIKGEVKKLIELKKRYGLKLFQITEDKNFTIKDYKKIQKISKIDLSPEYKKMLLGSKDPPNGEYNIWEPHGDIGLRYKGRYKFENFWKGGDLTADMYYEIKINCVYIDGKIYKEFIN